MGKPLMILAIADESYLAPLEVGLAESLYDVAELEVISDPAYFEEYFTAPRSADVLIIDETFYNERMRIHSVPKTFLLMEEPDTNEENQLGSRKEASLVQVFKYMNLQALMSIIIPPEWLKQSLGSVAQNKLIAVISAEGGIGSTVTALGVCAGLHQSLKRVLYLNLRDLQDFHFYLQNREPLSVQGNTLLRNPDPKLYLSLKQELRREGFAYLPPLSTSRNGLDISPESYRLLAMAAYKSGDYDAVVVDVGNELTPQTIPLLDAASKVLILTGQSASSVFKLRLLLHNLSCGDKEKFHFVCSRFEPEEENALLGGDSGTAVKVDEYIRRLTPQQLKGVKALGQVDGLQKIAYTLM